MATPVNPLDPLAEINNAEALTDWLDGLDCADLAPRFIAHRLLGQALLDADPEAIAELCGPDQRIITKQLQRLRDRQHALTPALTRAELVAGANHCRALGRDWQAQTWLPGLLTTWPGPIAHEVQALGDLLDRGQAAGALWQLRDLAGVLIKVPALILARDLLDHQAPPMVRERIHTALFAKPPSMGDWLGLARDLAKAVAAGQGSGLIAPALAGLFRRGKGASPLQRTLDDLVTFRNQHLGHGANRLDETEVADILRHALLGGLATDRQRALGLRPMTPLAQGLAFAAGLAPWQGLTLMIADPSTDRTSGADRPLIGTASLVDHHTAVAPGPASTHTDEPAPLVLIRATDGARLPLGPYLAARVCALCGYRDVFLFNGWDRRQARFDLLDYQLGHRMARAWHQVPDYHAEAARCPASADQPPPNTTEAALERGSVLALLDETAIDRRYLSPAYLRAPLRTFIDGQERGIWWLQAPGHLGKSLFVLGLAQAGRLGDEQSLLDDLRIAACFIRREYRYGPGQVLPLLEQAIKTALDLTERPDRRLPQFDLAAADPPADFARVLAECRALSVVGGPLLIALDGLDELRPPEGGRGVLDFLPGPDRLPPGVFLLLTSRPLAGGACPDWLAPALTRLAGPGLHSQTVDLADPGYRHLLRDYFDRALAEPRARLEAAAVRAGDPPPEARATVAARLDALFPVLLEKADGLFLYFAFLLERIRGREVALDDLADLPRRDALYTDFLDTLGAGLAPKQADLARTLLLTLAALEQAHAWYLDGREPPFAVEPEWHGVPLDGLADLVGYPGIDGNLLYTLFSLRSVLGAWRGEAARTSSYRLGLKGLTEAIAGHPDWGPALRTTHERLARETLGLLAESGADSMGGIGEPVRTPIGHVRLRYGFAHAVLAEQEDLLVDFMNAESQTKLMRETGHAAYDQTRLAQAGYWYSLFVLICAVRRQDCKARGVKWPPAWGNALATAYSNRGTARGDANDLRGALADYDAAVALREELRGRLGSEWPPAWGNDLAAAYMNRGVTRGECTDLEGALADHDVSIALREELRARLGVDWPPAWGNDLAAAYMNRGNDRGASNDLNGALIDFDASIALREGLRDRLRADWPTAWKSDLAAAYVNRGNVRFYVNDLDGALTDYDIAIVLMEELRDRLRDDWPPAWGNDLAGAYLNRANVHYFWNDLDNALTNYDTAIILQEGLRDRLRDDWPPAWGNDLAGAFTNRGLARSDSNDLRGALADYDTAIALREGLRKRLGAKWPPAWGNDLAMAYMNRGNARGDANDLPGALADYDTAIALREGLRKRLGAKWPPAWGNDLAEAYMNLGMTHETGQEPEAALADWETGRDLFAESLNRGYWPAGQGLLQCVVMALLLHSERAEWPEAAECLVDFLNHRNELEQDWPVSGMTGDPPWRDIVETCFGKLADLDQDQRASLLAALGDKADEVREILDW